MARRSEAKFAGADDGRCEAASKRTGQRCAQRAAAGKRLCRFHGGASTGSRTGPGALKHGLYSRLMPSRLAATYAAMLANPELRNLDRNIATIEALMADRLANLGRTPAAERFEAIAERFAVLKDKEAGKEEKREAFAALDELIAEGSLAAESERELLMLMDRQRAQVDTDVKRTQTSEKVFSAESFAVVLARIVHILTDRVKDRRILDGIKSDLDAILHQGS